MDGLPLSSSANGASALSVDGIIPFEGVKFTITSKSTYSLPPQATALIANCATCTISGLPETHASSNFVDAITLVPGADPITVSGTAYSLLPEAIALTLNSVQLIPGAKPIVVSEVTHSLAPKATAAMAHRQTCILLSGAEGDDTNAAAYAVDGTVGIPLVPGAEPVTVSGTTYRMV